MGPGPSFRLDSWGLLHARPDREWAPRQARRLQPQARRAVPRAGQHAPLESGPEATGLRLMPSRFITTADGRRIRDPRSTQAWRRLSKQVCREEPVCWLQLPGCTGLSDTGDHITPVVDAPELALVRSNVHGACKSCNYKRGNLPIESLRLRAGEDDPPEALSIFG